MIVECVGVSGAGKTALVKKLSEKYGLNVVPDYPSKLYGYYFITCHPIFITHFILKLISESSKTKTWSLFRFKIAVLRNTIARIEYARFNFSKDEFVFLDEGTMQRMLSVFETKQTEDSYAKWFRYFPHTNMVICVNNKSSDIAQRKVGTRRKKFGEEYVKNWFDTLKNNSDSIQKAITESEINHCQYHWNEEDNNFDEVVICLNKK
ncbi:MAG: GTPase SAR1 family protein [Candidatus Paceibacteria bacterium]|jgi:GTPase SAR1 family protein